MTLDHGHFEDYVLDLRLCLLFPIPEVPSGKLT